MLLLLLLVLLAACFCLLQLTTIPFDWIVLGCLGLQDSNNSLSW